MTDEEIFNNLVAYYNMALETDSVNTIDEMGTVLEKLKEELDKAGSQPRKSENTNIKELALMISSGSSEDGVLKSIKDTNEHFITTNQVKDLQDLYTMVDCGLELVYLKQSQR